MTSKQKLNKPQCCGECRYIQFSEKIAKDNYLSTFDGDEKWWCTQARMKVYRDEKVCPWGLKKDKPQK